MPNIREKLIELLLDMPFGNSTEEAEERHASDTANYLISNGVTVQEWISVKDRLPVEDGTYLVYTERGSVYASHFYTEKQFRSDYIREENWSQRGKVKVTHWMPLPEPPKGE